jgi:hypothetical protein
MVHARIEYEQKIEDAVSKGAVTADLKRSLIAAELHNPSLLTTDKTPITCERHTIGTKHALSTNRKP